ncbi:MAG: hypothetical protein V2B15_00715 [Bacteroidota bacterium]
MRKIVQFRSLAMTLLLAALAIPIVAQQPGGPPPDGPGGPGGPGRGFQMTEENIKENVDNLAETLSLNADQHKKILDYDMEFYTKMQVEREKHMGDRDAMRAAMMKARDERNEKYKEVLTPEQMKKFLEIQEQRRSQMREQREQGGQPAEAERPARGRGRN